MALARRVVLVVIAILAGGAGLASGASERPRTSAIGAEIGIGQLLGQEGCVSQVDPEDDSGYVVKGCRTGRAVLGPAGVLATPDGRNVYVAASTSSAVDSFSRDAVTGRISQTNCISQNGTTGVDGTGRACIDGDALRGANALAISPDGKHVYSTAYGSGGIGIFTRDPLTGRLAQTGCVRPVRTCTGVSGLGGAAGIAVSPDGANVYVAAADSDSVVMLARNPETGALKGLGCISDDGTDRVCAKGDALRSATDIVVSADGANVYVAAATSGAVLTFARDGTTGLLRQVGCLMYAAPRGGTCTRAPGLSGVVGLALAPDGVTLFAVSYGSSAVSVLSRGVNGVLRHSGCISQVYEYDENDNGKIDSDEAAKDGCVHVDMLSEPSAIAVTPDGRRLYVATSSGLTAFDRSRTTGGLSQAGCVSSRGPYDDDEDEADAPKCILVRGISGASDVTVSPDGRNVYVSSGYYDALVVLGPAASTSARVLAGRQLQVRVSCPASHVTPCNGRLALTRSLPRRALVRPRPYDVAAGTAQLYRLPLRRSALRTRATRARVPALLIAIDDGGVTDPGRRRLVLRGIHVKPRARPTLRRR